MALVMRQFIFDSWNAIMDHRVNPLRHIPDLQVRHMVMQVLAFMWSSIFAILIADSVFAFGVSAIAHVVFVAGIVVTIATFKVAERSPTSFNFLSGYHSLGRNRNYTMYRDKHGKLIKVYLPEGDPGGEHE
mgnify:FL=1|tara:strand:+ start:94 stop:486 length:393 start_codon:yes stop_codon:yes gene_type:complete